MHRYICAAPLLALFVLLCTTNAVAQKLQYFTTNNELLPQGDLFSAFEDRPDGCPPCFDCNREGFECYQYANCSKSSGRCDCPPGFGGEDCSKVLCGSLAGGINRGPRKGKECKCREGWEGINCNVCETDDACRLYLPVGQNQDAVCNRDGGTVKENHQMCNITNRKILDQLGKDKPQATFSCNAERAECNFQFWVAQKESFYCALDTCSWKTERLDESLKTSTLR